MNQIQYSLFKWFYSIKVKTNKIQVFPHHYSKSQIKAKTIYLIEDIRSQLLIMTEILVNV